MSGMRYLSLVLIGGLAGLPGVFAKDRETAAATVQSPASQLLGPWTGGYGGVPPWSAGTPESYEEALLSAIATRRTEVDAILAADGRADVREHDRGLENAGRPLDR